MTRITEVEFRRICDGIRDDRAVIIKHNPIGTEEETLLWMLMSVLISYLSLEEQDMPCFPGTPNADTYRQAISHILQNRKEGDFNETDFLPV